MQKYKDTALIIFLLGKDISVMDFAILIKKLHAIPLKPGQTYPNRAALCKNYLMYQNLQFLGGMHRLHFKQAKLK